MNPYYSNPGYNHSKTFYSYEHPSYSQLKQAAHQYTVNLLSKALHISNSFIPYRHPPSFNPTREAHVFPSQTSNFPKVIYMKPASDYNRRVFNPVTTYVSHHHHYHFEPEGKHIEKENERKKKEEKERCIVGLIGFVVACTTAFFIGKTVAEDESVKEEKDFENLKQNWNYNKIYYPPNYQFSVDDIICKTEMLLQRKKTHHTHKMALLILGFTAGGTAIAGALIGSTPLMLISTALGIGTAVGSLFKLGYTCFNTSDLNQAKELQENINNLFLEPATFAV